MNDTELDRLLDAWEAPAPAQSLRDGLRARFPRTERTRFVRPLKWGLAGLCMLGLTLAIGQTAESHGDFVMGAVTHVYEGLAMMVDAHRAAFITAEIRQFQPKVYVDGRLAGPLEYVHGSSFRVSVPGGIYGVVLFRIPKYVQEGSHWAYVEAGRMHGNLIEFDAGGHHVRIECNKTIVDDNRPVFIMRQPE